MQGVMAIIQSKSFVFPCQNKKILLYGCETWSLTLREEDGSRRKLYNDELHTLYSSPNIVRVIKSRRKRWAGHVARMWEGRGVYRFLVGRREGKRSVGRPRRRWEDNIKMNLRETGIDGENWIRMDKETVHGFYEHRNEPSGSIKKAGYCLTN
jgi:hypothetical protein